MKYSIYIIILLIGFWACADKPEPIMELSNAEAFAFDLGDSWEVNASVKAIGFAQNENENNFGAILNYSVDLVTPSSDSLESIYNDRIEASEYEEIMDLILEAQIEIDSSFSEGDYRLIFNVTDSLSKQSKSISVAFNLSK